MTVFFLHFLFFARVVQISPQIFGIYLLKHILNNQCFSRHACNHKTDVPILRVIPLYIYKYIYVCVCVYTSFCIPTIFSFSASMDLPSDGAEWGYNVIYWIIWMAYATPISQEKCEREINEMSAITKIAMRIGGMVRRGNRACTQIHTTTRTRSQSPDMRNLMDNIPYSFLRCCWQTFDVEISATNITCQSAHLCYPYSTGTRAHKTRMHVLTGGYQR